MMPSLRRKKWAQAALSFIYAILSPLLLTTLYIMSLTNERDLSYNGYVYEDWAQALGNLKVKKWITPHLQQVGSI